MWEHMGRVGVVLIAPGLVLTVGFIGLGPVLVLLGILLILIRRAWVLPSRGMSILIGVVAGLTAWYYVLPLGCDATACSTLLGLPSPGGGWALLAGCVVGLGVGLFTAHATKDHGPGGWWAPL